MEQEESQLLSSRSKEPPKNLRLKSNQIAQRIQNFESIKEKMKFNP